jgi:hypothetical protein
MAHADSTFVLRLWTANEARAGGQMLRRGRLDHLQSGDHLYFDHLPEALSFIRARFGGFDDLARSGSTPLELEDAQQTVVKREGSS